jgi:hypothetical protein
VIRFGYITGWRIDREVLPWNGATSILRLVKSGLTRTRRRAATAVCAASTTFAVRQI